MGLEMVRFDQPCFVVKGAVEYFREHMALGDYLTQDGQSEMTWFGQGAAMLGLEGQCDLDHFERLCRGVHPLSGQKLMVRNKGRARRVCYFAQISPPKDVSILHLVGGDQRIAGWWKDAVAETLREIEAVTATRVRRGGANDDRCTGNMVTAIVTHDSNRSLDPQLHTHLCIMNVTFDAAENRWKSVQPSAFYRHQGYFREVCYNRLAARMLEAGYELEPVRGIGFTVAGLPSELRDTFSKRRHAILREAAQAGTSSQDELQNIALRTRADKTNATAATLRSRWLEECGDYLDALKQIIARASGPSQAIVSLPSVGAIDSATAHVFERRSVAADRDLLREALVVGRGRVTLNGLKHGLGIRERDGELIRSGNELASRDGLESEKEFTGWAAAELTRCDRLGVRPDLSGLGEDQAEAVRGLLRSGSRVTVLQGDAGTGKTTSLKTIVAGIELGSSRVFGCAPSAGATDVLRRELTPAAETLQQLLVNESLQKEIRGQVILVDEASLVSVREMRDLCRLAARNENRLLFVGDIKQHGSVEAGDALRALQMYAHVPVFRLTQIRRQVDPEYRKAVSLLARGDARSAFRQFWQLGAVRELDGENIWAVAATDFVRTVRAGKSCLAISPVWSEIHRFTVAVREQLKLAKLVATEERTIVTVHPLKLTREERRLIRNYQPGDVLTFHQAWGDYAKHDSLTVVRREDRHLRVRHADGRLSLFDPQRVRGFDVGLSKEIAIAVGERLLIRGNLAEAGVRNGDIVEVASLAEDGAVALTDGRKLPAWFRNFSHGYATTSHAAQGKTIDRGILLMAEAGIATGNLKQAYVSNSRFRESQVIFTSDANAACEAMTRPADRQLAMELTQPAHEEDASPARGLRERAAIAPKAALGGAA